MKVIVFCAVMALTCQALRAQHPQPHPQAQPQPHHDPIGANFFPPEMVMQHQQAIGLTEEQRNFISAEIQKAQARFTELQWQMASEMETLSGLVSQARVDEQQTLAQLDKIMALEGEIKRSHFALVVRIKNRMTPEQQARLQELKRGRR